MTAVDGPEGFPPLDDPALWIARLGIRPTDRVLEVGGAANAFARADVVCDLTFGRTNQRNGAPGVLRPGVAYVETAAESLPFPDGAFDFVWCTQVLEHVVDPVLAAAELSRVARRGFVEVPSRTGEMMNGNPTHRWVVDREGDVLVFRPRTFVEHPFDHLFYGAIFRDPDLRRRAEGPLRGELNHQILFDGALQVRVEPVPPGAAAFDYEDPVQAGRAHFHFARCCLLGGADLSYAFTDAEAAATLLPGCVEARLLAAVYRARALRLDDATEAIAGVSGPAVDAARRLIAAARAGDMGALAALPVPPPIGAAGPGAAPAEAPLVSLVVPAPTAEGVREAVEGAVTQDYPRTEIVVAAGCPAETRAALASFAGIKRLRIVDAPGLSGGELFHAALSSASGAVLGVAMPGHRHMPGHVEKLTAALYASGADAVYGDLVRVADGGVEESSLDGRNASVAVFPFATLLGRREAFVRVGAFGPGDAGVASWLAQLAAAARPLHVPVVTVSAFGPRPSGVRVLDAARAALHLDPTELLREVVSLHARLAARPATETGTP